MRFTTCVLVAGLVLSGAACTAEEETAKPALTTTTTTTTSATDLADGKHVAYITGIDLERRQLTVDVVQMGEDESGHPDVVNTMKSTIGQPGARLSSHGTPSRRRSHNARPGRDGREIE